MGADQMMQSFKNKYDYIQGTSNGGIILHAAISEALRSVMPGKATRGIDKRYHDCPFAWNNEGIRRISRIVIQTVRYIFPKLTMT